MNWYTSKPFVEEHLAEALARVETYKVIGWHEEIGSVGRQIIGLIADHDERYICYACKNAKELLIIS